LGVLWRGAGRGAGCGRLQRTAILAELDAAAIFFAGTRPERTSALILVHTSAKGVASHDYPIGVAAEVAEALLAQFDLLWGTEAMATRLVPSRAEDARFRRWFAKAQRTSLSPRAAQPYLRAMLEVDVRPILPLVQAPTLILHRRDVQSFSVEQGRYLAEHIPGARLVELPGADATLVWEAPELALDLIQQFLTGVHRPAEPTRMLVTVLFSDIVASTQRASQLGDRRWRELLNVHDELARRLVEEFGGRLVKTTGDGLLATFDGLERQGLGDRCVLRPGDLFAPPPPADLYLLARVLHDWDDHDAARILAALGRGATQATRLRVFEMLLPDDDTPHRAKMSDVAMLLLFGGGRERTAGEFWGLLERTGWRLERVVPSPGPMSIIEASRSPTT
jgi:hypothetical protein